MELNEYHPFTCVGVAHHDVAQQTMLCPDVIKFHACPESVITDVVADLVAEIVHQPAFLDRVDLVESSCDMEADGPL